MLAFSFTTHDLAAHNSTECERTADLEIDPRLGVSSIVTCIIWESSTHQWLRLYTDQSSHGSISMFRGKAIYKHKRSPYLALFKHPHLAGSGGTCL